MDRSHHQSQDVAAIALLDEPTRRRIYEVVVAEGQVGRDRVAAALGIGRELAAFHLDRLVDGGLLATDYRRLSGRTGPGAGRPAKLYSRADRDVSVSFPARRYQDVAEVFAEGLESLTNEVGPDAVDEAVKSAAHRHGAAAGVAVVAATGDDAPPAEKRAELLHLLSVRGFEPTVDSATGTVALGNCPYRVLASAHRDLTCGANVAWAEGLVDVVGETGLTPRFDPRPGVRCCVVFEPD